LQSVAKLLQTVAWLQYYWQQCHI